MGGCQNYGPYLGTLNIRCRIIIGTQRGTIILTSTHMANFPGCLASRDELQRLKRLCLLGFHLAVITTTMIILIIVVTINYIIVIAIRVMMVIKFPLLYLTWPLRKFKHEPYNWVGP